MDSFSLDMEVANVVGSRTLNGLADFLEKPFSSMGWIAFKTDHPEIEMRVSNRGVIFVHKTAKERIHLFTLAPETEYAKDVYAEMRLVFHEPTVWIDHPATSAVQSEIVSVEGPTPPATAVKLSRWIPRKHRETVLGDLEELYPLMVKDHGVKVANRRFFWGVVFSYWPLFRREVEKWAEIVGKLKLK